MSLFPDDYPPNEPEVVVPKPCCEYWASFVEAQDTDGVHLVWTCVHRLAHGRTPFTAEALAEMARVSVKEADTVIRSALERQWLNPVQAEYHMQFGATTGLYQGRLRRQR
jgi:hypothetical protein